MRILEICYFSAGGCGVYGRVRQESQLLSKRGYEVMIFSTNVEKGTGNIVPSEDKIGKVNIKRFPSFKLGGENFSYWNFEKEAINFKPDVIIAHSYRHMHTGKALKVGGKIGCKVILVTHAPFAREKNRGFLGNIAVGFYDKFIGKNELNKFDKIFAITNWEIPYLEKLGVKKDKIEYVPNGIPDEFFGKIKSKTKENILYMGRIADIKQLETVINALPNINKKVNFEMYGPAELNYLEYLEELVENLKIVKRIKIVKKGYNKKEQIKELDDNLIFILPSKSEGMPQTLIEAMARERIVFGSDNLGNKDLINNAENGFLFKNGDEKDLADNLNQLLSMNKEKIDEIRKNARKSVEQFKWSRIIEKIEENF